MRQYHTRTNCIKRSLVLSALHLRAVDSVSNADVDGLTLYSWGRYKINVSEVENL